MVYDIWRGQDHDTIYVLLSAESTRQWRLTPKKMELKTAGIEEGDAYDLVETDSIDDKCLLSAITDDILYKID